MLNVDNYFEVFQLLLPYISTPVMFSLRFFLYFALRILHLYQLLTGLDIIKDSKIFQKRQRIPKILFLVTLLRKGISLETTDFEPFHFPLRMTLTSSQRQSIILF